MSVILATAGYDHKIRFWEAPSGICSRTIRYPDSQVNCLEITPDKQFLAAGGNPHIRLFEINPSIPMHDNMNGRGHANHSHNGGSNNNVNVTNGGGGGVNGGSGYHHQNHQHQNPVLQCEGHTSSVTSIGFQRDGPLMYSSSEDHTVKIWDLRCPTGTCSRSFDSGAPVNSVALHPNQNYLISGDQSGSIKIWDLKGYLISNSYSNVSNSKNNINSNDVSPNSSIVNGNPSDNFDEHKHEDDESINKVKATTGTSDGEHKSTDDEKDHSKSKTHCINELLPGEHDHVHSGRFSIQAVDFSEDGRFAMAATNHAEIFLWNPSNIYEFIPLRKFRAHALGSYLLCAKISPDGRSLVTTSSDKTAKLWNTSTGECTETLNQHQRWVWDAVFSADSSYLVTASSDHWARLWNLRSGEVVRQYAGHQSAVTCVALNDSST